MASKCVRPAPDFVGGMLGWSARHRPVRARRMRSPTQFFERTAYAALFIPLMNTQKLPLLIGIWLASQTQMHGQVASNVTFTRITSGPIATDVAHSFGCAWGDYDGDGY